MLDAARMCATTPAAALGRPDLGALAEGRAADVVVLDEHLQVRHTWVAGVQAWNSDTAGAVFPSGGPQ
jgi:N-acetylglucosamine-6-phosphate deacetylase